MRCDRFRTIRLAAAALSLAAAALGASAAAQQKKMSAAEIQALAKKIRPDGYTSAAVCGSCHTDIHKAWSESAHARAVTDPAFRAGLAESVEQHGKDTQRLCLTCHAPTTRFTKSADLEDPLVQEGITCDFCHTVKSVDLSRKEEPFEMVPGLTKYGPFEYAPSPAHQTAFSVLHRNKPTLCAACHEYTNARGFPALTTYSEWLKSPYPAQGVSCQDCHMALVQGDTVQPSVRVRDVGTYRFVNLHRLVGGGSLGQLRRGLDLTVHSAEARGESGHVEVEIANTAAGHRIPTGLPSKQLVLTVRALSGGKQTWEKTVVYDRRVYDAQSRVIRTDGDLFLSAVRQGRDDRIAPGEKRRESFRFPLKSGSMEAEITLAYRYHAPGAAEPKILVIARESREIRRR
jgi:nitrate/TMAO reductase-like tetraheme cytochrome c subunit